AAGLAAKTPADANRRKLIARLDTLADQLSMMGQAAEAQSLFEKTLALDPKEVDTLKGLSWLLASRKETSQKDLRRAVEMAERGKAQMATRTEFLGIIGLASWGLGDVQAAAEAIKQQQQANAGQPDGLGEFLLAMIPQKRGDAKSAREHFDVGKAWL